MICGGGQQNKKGSRCKTYLGHMQRGVMGTERIVSMACWMARQQSRLRKIDIPVDCPLSVVMCFSFLFSLGLGDIFGIQGGKNPEIPSPLCFEDCRGKERPRERGLAYSLGCGWFNGLSKAWCL